MLSKFVLEPQGHIRKPFKRLQAVDPLAPITPVPLKTKVQRQQRGNPKTPVPMNKFTTRQIQGSQNQTAARVLFTPRANQQHPRTGHIPASQPPPSPTPLRAHQPLPTSSPDSSSSHSEAEDRLRVRLERLNLQPQSASGSQSPRAGPHSKPTRVPVKPKTRGGAKDVWHFFEKESECHTCILCRCVIYFIFLTL